MSDGSSEDGERKPSATAEAIASFFDDVDRRLARATGDRVDLRVAFPLTLAALGLWSATGGGLRLRNTLPTAFFWYAFSAFHGLNRRAAPREGTDDRGS
jgi:hypothetical protein